MSLLKYQQILIKDVFHITFIQQEQHKFTYFPSFMHTIKQFSACNQQHYAEQIDLLQNLSLCQILLKEYLRQIPDGKLQFLQESLQKAQIALQKPWNNAQQHQQIIKYCMETIKKYILIILDQSELSNKNLIKDENILTLNSQNHKIALKMMNYFQERGQYHMPLVNLIINNKGQQFYSYILEVLYLKQKCQTIISSNSLLYLGLFVELLSKEAFRLLIVNFRIYKFMPITINQLNKESEAIDCQSIFGVFLKMSLLGHRAGDLYLQKLSLANFQEKMTQQLGSQNVHITKLKMNLGLQQQFYELFLQSYKLLLKKSTLNEFMEWNYVLLLSNQHRPLVFKKISNLRNSKKSHDGILVNAYYCFVNIFKKILTNEQLLKAIDPNYFRFHRYSHLFSYDSIFKTIQKIKEEPKEYGTITEYCFLSIQFLFVGVCEAMRNIAEYNELKNKMQSARRNFGVNHTIYKRMTHQIAALQSKISRYYIVLFHDQTLIRTTIELLDFITTTLPRWLGFRYQNLNNSKLQTPGTQLKHYLPEMLIQVVSKYHRLLLKTKRDYIKMIPIQHLRNVMHLTCFLLADQQISSNYYNVTFYIELIYEILLDSKGSLLLNVIATDQLCLNNLLFGIIKSYSDIAFTGRHNQYYQKLSHHFKANKILCQVLRQHRYQLKLKTYLTDKYFQKFIHHIVSNTTLFIDDININYEKYKLFEAKPLEALNPEEVKDFSQSQGMIKTYVLYFVAQINLLKDIVIIAPEIFLGEGQMMNIVVMLNRVLQTWTDPCYFTSNNELVKQKLKGIFKKEEILSHIIDMYTSIDNDELPKAIKNEANYKKDYFVKALQKASHSNFSTIDSLERFQALINKINSALDDQDDEQIYGQIPERYLCALMSTLMKDPVKLPSSGHVVDKNIIKKHLLSDERCPFTRSPMRQQNLINEIKLKEQIQLWKKNRLKQLKKGDKQIKYGKRLILKIQKIDETLQNNQNSKFFINQQN